MIYLYTAFLHGLMAILILLSLIYLFYRKKEVEMSVVVVDNYFNWFFFYFFYNVFLVLPLVFFDRLNLFVGYSYYFALIFQAIAAWYAFKAGVGLMSVKKSTADILSFLYITGVMVAVLLHFLYPEVPAGTTDQNWVLWYSNQPRSLLYTFFMFVAGWTFALANLKGFNSISLVSLKIRACFFMLAAFTLPFAAFYYFGARNVNDIYLAFVFAVLGLLFFAVGNVIVRFILKENQG